MSEITFITFNYGNAGPYINGPGICLVNFVKQLRSLGYHVNVFSQLPSKENAVYSLNDINFLYKVLKRSKIVHHWSGLSPIYSQILTRAHSLGSKIIIGPNVLDTVLIEQEERFLKEAPYHHILTVNLHLKFRLIKTYQIPLKSIDLLMVGPDPELWSPNFKDNGKILWKGNSKHFVKDINFGLEVAKRLPEYEFEFLGYPKPYNYLEHIEAAKSCHLYFSTSLSETMGMTLLEAWMSGLPSITHPKIYLHGENYKTGIITDRNIESYCLAIKEIMEDDILHQSLSKGAQDYVKTYFSNTAQDYLLRYYES